LENPTVARAEQEQTTLATQRIVPHVGRNKVAQVVCRNRANASGGVTHLVHTLCGEKRPKFRHSMRLLVPAYKLVNNSMSNRKNPARHQQTKSGVARGRENWTKRI
jgi:hypothetical protein